jgi:hypothetical protein
VWKAILGEKDLMVFLEERAYQGLQAYLGKTELGA